MRWMAVMGPWCLPGPMSIAAIRPASPLPAAPFFFMLADSTMPCSVPTRYLAGPASTLYSMDEPPSTRPAPSERDTSSVGSDSLRVSQNSMRPSVETETNWLFVLLWIQNVSYTGS